MLIAAFFTNIQWGQNTIWSIIIVLWFFIHYCRAIFTNDISINFIYFYSHSIIEIIKSFNLSISFELFFRSSYSFFYIYKIKDYENNWRFFYLQGFIRWYPNHHCVFLWISLYYRSSNIIGYYRTCENKD
jgi:hypothetical protein